MWDGNACEHAIFYAQISRHDKTSSAETCDTLLGFK